MLDEELKQRLSARAVPRQPLLLRRTVAALIDTVLLLGSLFLIWKAAALTPDVTGNYGTAGCSFFVVSFFLWLAYYAGAEAFFGRTLGKAVMGIKVIATDGSQASLLACIKRHLLDLVEFQAFGIPAAIAVMVTPTHQRLGDLFAGTHVVRDEIIAG